MNKGDWSAKRGDSNQEFRILFSEKRIRTLFILNRGLLSSGYGHCHCHCTVTLYPGAAPAAGQTRPKNYIAISYFRHFLLSVVEAVDHAVNAETPRIFISISYFRVDLTLGRPPVHVKTKEVQYSSQKSKCM